jgi:hypothetical protein
MYHSSFLDSKRYNSIHIENNQEVRNISLAPFIVEGGSIFKKTSYFLESLIIGQSKDSKEGMISYREGNFAGFDGEKWKTFTKENAWIQGEEDNIVYTSGRCVGINKMNPKKALEVGGDVLIDKKLVVREDTNLDVGVCLGENLGKKKPGYIRFWENSFEGFNGENWIKFGDKIEPSIIIPEVIPLDLASIEKIRSKSMIDTNFYYNFEKNEFRMEKLNNNGDSIKMEDLSIGNIKVSGDIIFSDGKVRHAIRNISDPVYAGDVATKRYVDQICQGLQNYIVCDFLCMTADGFINDELELTITRQIGEINIGKYIVILNRVNLELFKIIHCNNDDISTYKLEKISDIELPAKIYIREGRYGRSEYFLFKKDGSVGYDFLQISGMEALEYTGGLSKIGKEIRLKLDSSFFKENTIGITLLENSIDASKYLKEGTLKIDPMQIPDGIIESRHIASKTINGTHIQLKSIGDSHLKDGFIRNHHLTPGIITEKELSSESIDKNHLKSGIILNKNLTEKCIMSNNISDGQIESHHLSDLIIDTKHIGEKVILGDNIGNQQIRGEHLRNEIIQTAHFTSKCINNEHINDGAIKKSHIMQNSIGSIHIEENAITSQHIRQNTISSGHILKNTILSHHIASCQIQKEHIDDSFLEERHLCDKIIGERHLIDGVITNIKIKNNAIEGRNILMNSIEDKHIMNFSIRGNKLMDGSISEQKLIDGIITTNKIKDKSITNDKIKLPFIKVSSDPVFTCTQVVNFGDTLNLGLNQNYMIPKIRDGVAEFMTNVRFGEEGSHNKMEINMPVEFQGGEKLHYIGEVISFIKGIKLSENFLKKWVKCDGNSVRKSDYYDLYKCICNNNNENDSSSDYFNLPNIQSDCIDYYLRFT